MRDIPAHLQINHLNWRTLISFWLALAVFCAAVVSNRADDLDSKGDPRFPRISGVAPGELIVRFKAGATADRKARVAKKFKATARDLVAPNSRIARLGNQPASATEQTQLLKVEGNIEQAKAALEKEPDVLYVEPNFKTRVFDAIIPNDFEFEALYSLHNTGADGGKAGADVKAPEAWGISTGSRDIIVAVIDTGMDYFHEDLRANVWTNAREIPGNGIDDDGNGYVDDVHGYDFVSDDTDPMDDHFHGTHVSGTIGAVGNNGLGIAGICWNVRLMAIKAFDELGNGTVSAAVAAIHYAVVNGARVINASWGLEDRSRALSDAVAEAQAAGIIFVAAAGNSHTDTPFYPAGYDSVIAVASTNNRDERSPFSNYGAHVDLAAPGEQILSTIPDGRYDSVSGTSMSAPHVAGAAALVLSQHPNFTAAQVTTILKNTADPIPSDKPIGRGRLNVFKAVQIELPLPFAALTIPTQLFGRVDFRGTAFGEHFQRYALSYGAGSQPASWTEFFASTQPVTNAVFTTGFDTSILNDGVYTFRLTVWNDNGQSSSDVATVKILNVQVNFPLSADILRAGSPLEIRGTVFGQGRHFGFEWSQGVGQSNWFSTGFSLPTNAEVLNGALATFDTSLVPPNQYYSFRLSATNAAGEVQRFYVNFVWLDSHLKAGWPVYLPHDGEYALEDFRQAKVADLDGDGHQEILIVDHGNSEGKIARLLVFNDDGSLKWSRDLNGEAPYADVPTIADMDGDGKPEIFVDVGSQLFAFAWNGADLPGLWPLKLNARGLGKVAADLDGDGKKELIGLANVPSENAPTLGALNVYDLEGHVLQHWNVPLCGATNIVQRIFPVVANMDDDRDLEIVVVSGCDTLELYDLTSPDAAVWSVGFNASAISSPVVADIDHDGKNDIVVTTWSAKDFAGIYLFDRKGKLAPGWPAVTEDSFLAPAAVADLDGDGYLEIVAAGDRLVKLHALVRDGFELEGWPVSISNVSTAGGISLADIDGDGRTEVIYSSPGFLSLAFSNSDPGYIGGIKAWDGSGRPINLNGSGAFTTIPLEGSASSGYFKAPPVTVTDLDHNGKIDLIAASIRDRTYVPLGQSAAFKNRSSLYVWELDSPLGTNSLSWPQFQHGTDNNGFLPTPKPPPQPPELLQIPDQIVAVGQPFPDIPLDQFLFFPGEVVPGLFWGGASIKDLDVNIGPGNIAHVTARFAWEGSEQVTYTVTDGASFSKSITVLYSARRGYFPPNAVADSITTKEDTSIAIDVLANDSNAGGGSLTLVSVSRPAHGNAFIDAGKVTYRPATNYFGSDTFTYFVQNEAGAKALGSVAIQITSVNDAPVAGDDRVLTFEDHSIDIAVLGNDVDVDGDILRLAIVATPQNGAVAITQDQKIRYTPAPSYNGTNTFLYAVIDPLGLSSTGKVTVTVRPANSAPVAFPQSVVMTRNSTKEILYMAEDLEDDAVRFRIIKPPDHGELFSYPTLGEYTPTKGYFGTDSFSYRASDGQLESAEAFVQITILNTNNAPRATSLSLMTRVNQAAPITLAAVDDDSDPVTFRIIKPPTHGIIDGVGSNYVYTPNLDYLGKDEFTFGASDGFVEGTGKISLETTDKNTAPFANIKFVKTFPNTPASFVITGVDAESNPLNFNLVSQPKHGVLTGGAPYLVYNPDPNYIGPDRFKFTVRDSEFTSDPAAVTISVAAKNNLPAATSQTVTAFIGAPTSFDLNVHDLDGDPLQIVVLKGTRFGKINGTGTAFIYTPTNSVGSADYFTYKAWDGHNYGNEAQVRIEPTRPPVVPAGFDSILIGTNAIQLLVTNQVGQAIRIQSTIDFNQWTTVTNIDSTSGKFLYSVTPTNVQTYFRAVVD